MDEEEFNWIRDRVGWELGVILLSVALSPILSSMLITPLYVGIGVPGYGTPTLQTSVQQEEPIYPNGATVQRFDNLTWKSDYSIYHVSLRHEGGPVVERAVFEIRFPGCVKSVKRVQPNPGSSPISIHSPLKPTVEATQPPKGEVMGCTAQIVTESIHRYEGYSFDFVIEHQPDYCDMLVAYNPNKKYLVEYSWYQSDKLFQKQMYDDVTGAGQAYSDVGLPPNSTLIKEKGDGFKVYIVGAGGGNETLANQICFGDQVQR